MHVHVHDTSCIDLVAMLSASSQRNGRISRVDKRVLLENVSENLNGAKLKEPQAAR